MARVKRKLISAKSDSRSRKKDSRRKKEVYVCKVKVLKKLEWTICDRCGSDILSSDTENLGCGRNHTVPENLIALPFVPDELLELIKKEQLLRDRCRLFNNMFAFSAIGSSGGFEKIPGGPSNVILHGKAYHRMLPGTVFVLHMYR